MSWILKKVTVMGKGGRTVLDKETKSKEKNPIYIMSEPTLYPG